MVLKLSRKFENNLKGMQKALTFALRSKKHALSSLSIVNGFKKHPGNLKINLTGM